MRAGCLRARDALEGVRAGEAAARPWGDVLEVGAGIGATCRTLINERVARWTCLEPDPELAKRIPRDGPMARCEVRVGTLEELPRDRRFDAILYLDVIEHIVDDAAPLFS